jgi:diguanylate cyclase (GGDEF)-like protein
MRKAIVIIYAILSVFVFIAIFLVLGFWFMELDKVHSQQFKDGFQGLQQKAALWEKGFGGLDSPEFRKNVDDAIARDNTLAGRLAAYAIYSRQYGIILWSSKATDTGGTFIKAESHLLWAWKGFPEYAKDLFGMSVVTLRFTPESDDVYFESLYYSVTRAEIFDTLKWGFLALSIWLILAIVIRLFLAAKPDPNPYVLSEQEADTQNRLYQAPPEQEDTIVVEKEKAIIMEEEEEPAPRPQPVKKPKEVPKEIPRETPRKSNDLFSPRTGLGWEEHMESRIKFELKRTASFDQDMVLALIRIDKGEKNADIDSIYPALARIIHDIFQFQDLSFEYGQYGYAIVMTDMNLNTAIEQMKSFQRRISKERFDQGPVRLSIGLSARNGRLLSEKVLLQEAVAALEKAEKDGENRIVAFKPDPDKYRDFVSKKV